MSFKSRIVALFSALCVTWSVTAVDGVEAQSVQIGADFVSRYVWRGVDFGESVSIQPTIALQAGGLEIGTWASYAAGPEAAGFNEHDLWINYTLAIGGASLSFGATDYYFPAPFDDGVRDPSTAFFNFDGGGRGAHWIEPFVSASGPPSFPFTIYGSMMAHNDPDRSVYLEVGYPFSIDGTNIGLALGGVPMASDFYLTGGPAVVNLGLSAGRAIPVTDSFSIPVSVTYILNPYAERSFLVFGIRL
jgi:hypothetical protein